ncbi:MAG: hypothetical protein ACRDFT_01755 [bacterium]
MGATRLARDALRRIVTWIIVLSLALLPGAASASLPHELIVPSRGIGPFRLGMTASAIQALKKAAPCNVAAVFKDDRAIRLETNCGGAYHTAEWVQVGIGPGTALWHYGTPDDVTRSNGLDYRADWLHYRGGIAFRVVYGSTNPAHALIQAIAVFPGTGRLQVREGPAPDTPSSPGGVGE